MQPSLAMVVDFFFVCVYGSSCLFGFAILTPVVFCGR